MGMVRKDTPKILLALDVSGSMHQPQLDKCLGVASSVGRVFKSGVDILFFDTEVRSVLPLRMALDEIVVPGGGGTDFQPAVDHALKGHYDALVFLTDGEGDAPVFPSFFSSHILWCCVADSKPFMSQFSIFKI
jgi:predicted metal-dependent peptidase